MSGKSGILQKENTKLSPRTDDRYEPGGRWPFTRDPLPAWNSLNEHQQKDLAKRMAVYAAMIDNVDQNIGRLLEFLETRGELNNTMILFLSDNGGAIGGNVRGMNALGERGNLDAYGTTNSFISYGLGWANASNTPFRMYKCYVHEGGIASPLIAHWPKGIKEEGGTLIHTPTHITDLMPSILTAAGAKYPEKVNGNKMIELPGQSLLPLMTKDEKNFNEDRRLFWEHAGSKAVRDRKWKLVKAHKEPWELYDMDKDRSESDNLIKKYPQQAKKMIKMYDEELM